MLIIGVLCWHYLFGSKTYGPCGDYISLNTLLMLKLAEYGLSYHIYYTLKNVVD